MCEYQNLEAVEHSSQITCSRIRKPTVVCEAKRCTMSQEDGDHDMADATAGAEANGSADGEIVVEKQRLRLVCDTGRSKTPSGD